MLTSITIRSTTDIIIPIIGSTVSSKYVIKSISGLGPPDIDVAIGALASDGGVYQNRRTPQRNPVILMGFNPNYKTNETVDDLRDAMYEAFLEPSPDSDFAQVVLHDTVKPNRFIDGVVEKIEISHFTKDPEIQISILCPYPFLTGALTSIIPDVPNIIEIDNIGTASCGFHMVVQFTNDVTGFTMSRGSSTLYELSYEFLTDDVLEIDTTVGSRKVRVQRAGVWRNIIDFMVDFRRWPKIIPNEDTITLSTSDIQWDLFEYVPQWWGV